MQSNQVPVEKVPLGPKPAKAYKDNDFLSSPEARMIRIMCELQQPGCQLEKEGVENIVMFFGSARAKSKEEYTAAVTEAQVKADQNPDDADKKAALDRLKKMAFIIPSYEATRDLAGKLTRWNMERQPGTRLTKPTYIVGTGGGPGMMQAANEGAYKAGGKSCGLGISLPFEDRLNPYCTPELSFEFHYFFTRKFWMAYKVMGLIVAPGGLGTCDELFELLTLKQTGRIKTKLPIILINKKFWKDCINWQAFVDYGMISQTDYDSLHFADTADEAFEILKNGIESIENDMQHAPKKARKGPYSRALNEPLGGFNRRISSTV
jgi:uncharacterized protein (TIGR00730 family)